MNNRQQIGVLSAAFTLVLCMKLTTSLPMKTFNEEENIKVGQVFYVSSAEELERLGNGTVPEALLSDLTPPEYYKLKGNGPDALSNLMGLAITSKSKRSARGIFPACKTSYVANFEDDRKPAIIQKAFCTVQGPTCSSSGGYKCMEMFTEKNLFRYIGNKGKDQVWKYVKELLPISCTCASS